jgi:glucosamine-6-phosphate deaminase
LSAPLRPNVFASDRELAAAVAEALHERLLAAVRRPARASGSSVTPLWPLGLATGRTMRPVYRRLRQRLAAWPEADRQTLRALWCSFNLDEYVGLPPDHPGSFRASMARDLAEPLGLRAGSWRLPCGVAEDPEAEASAYGTALRRAGGPGLQLLGLGANGHIAFNEPPARPDCRCRVVELAAGTRQSNAADFASAAMVPRRAITLGLEEILSAGEIWLIAAGHAKAAAVRRALLEPEQAGCPASWLRGHQRLRIWLDADAAAELRRRPASSAAAGPGSN